MAHETAAKSPFPGMDPYLQRHWSGVHTRLMTYAADALQPQLPGDLVARVEENLPLQSADRTENRHLEIRGFSNDALNTIIQFLSPNDKLEETGRSAYKKTRLNFLRAKSSIVEIDLIRGGAQDQMNEPFTIPERYRSTYCVIIQRLGSLGRLEVWPVSLVQELPTIPIPLGTGENDILLDLQSLIEMVYRNGRFDRIDYSRLCEPPLEGEELKAAEPFLRRWRLGLND